MFTTESSTFAEIEDASSDELSLPLDEEFPVWESPDEPNALGTTEADCAPDPELWFPRE
jgi:hypothetical protein